jgi:hypothetical protein
MQSTISQQTKDSFFNLIDNLRMTNNENLHVLPNGHTYNQIKIDHLTQVDIDKLFTENFKNRTQLSNGASHQFIAFENKDNEFILIQPSFKEVQEAAGIYYENNGTYITKFNNKYILKDYIRLSQTFSTIYGSTLKSLLGFNPVEKAVNNVDKISLSHCEKPITNAITKIDNLRDKFFKAKNSQHHINNT